MKLLLYISIFSHLFNTSCKTIIYGSSEKIKISSTVPNTQLSLNNGPYMELPTTISLSKKKSEQKIKLIKEGYNPVEFSFTGTEIPSSLSQKFLFQIGGALTVFGALRVTQGLRSNLIDPTSGLIIAGSGATILAGTTIDAASKSSKSFFHKEIEFDLIPIPQKVNSDSMESIACSSVNFRIQPGTFVGGSFKTKNRNFEKNGDINWDESSNVVYSDVEVQVNNDLYDFAYPVPGLKNKFVKDAKSAKFLINAEVKNIQLDEYIFQGKQDRKCATTISWTVYDNRFKKVVFEKEIKNRVFVNNQTFKAAILQCVSASLKHLMSDPEFAKKISKTITETIVLTKKSEKINISLAKPPAQIQDLIESVITIDMGDSHGSGFLISSDGYAITSYHVVENEKSVNVFLSNGLMLSAEVILSDELADLALIKLSGRGFKPMAINQVDIPIGGDVLAIGTPGKIELGQSISKGIISGKREIEKKLLIQTDVSVSPGNSGGPLINKQNEVIGIVTSKLVGTGIEGIGFAIPMSVALEKLNIEIR